jgi:cytochrome d ubiquinol oxidase subunit I
MVGSGVVLMLLSLWFWVSRWRKGDRVFGSRRLLIAMVLCGPIGFLGLEAGWFVTEVGRQPWVIRGVLRTREAVTPAEGVPPMFFAFAVLYVVLGVTTAVLLNRLRSRSEGDAS